MPKFMTYFTLKFSCRTLESFGMQCVTSPGTFVRVCIQLLEIRGFLGCGKVQGLVVLQFLPHHWGLFPLGIISCHALMLHNLNLCHQYVSSHMSNVFSSGFRALHLLGQLSNLTGRKFLYINIAFIYCFDHKVFVFHEKPEDISV